MSKITVLYPFKRNSQRVPGKNFKKLAGKELYKWMLEKLIVLDEVEEIIINTDAKDILQNCVLAKHNKVQVRDRKNELCGDDVSMNLIIEDDILSSSSESFLMTHTTNPFLSKDTLKTAINLFFDQNHVNCYDSLFSVNAFQSRFYWNDLTPINHDPKNLIQTQDLGKIYEENSNFYIFSRDSFLKTKSRIGSNPSVYELDKLESIDIDNHEDWDFAELIAQTI